MDILHIKYHCFNGHLLKLYLPAAEFYELLNKPETKLKPNYTGSGPNLIISYWPNFSINSFGLRIDCFIIQSQIYQCTMIEDSYNPENGLLLSTYIIGG